MSGKTVGGHVLFMLNCHLCSKSSNGVFLVSSCFRAIEILQQKDFRNRWEMMQTKSYF